MRHTADVDLLVRPQDFDRACALFGNQGMVDSNADLPVHLLVESTFQDSTSVELDLHHRLFRFGDARDDLLFANPVSLPDGGGLAMPAEARLLHAAAHLLLSPPGKRRLSSLFDVTVLIARDDIDIAAALELADWFGMYHIVQFAIWLSRSIVDGDESPKPPATRTFINAAHLRTQRSVLLETCAVVANMTGFKNRLDYLRYQLPKVRSGS